MKTNYLNLLICISIAFSACKSDKKQTDSVGTNFILHRQNEGPKAKMGDHVTLHMLYATPSDSVIFTTYDKPDPLSFNLQQRLFGGTLNSGLTQMAAGDSATFFVVADTLYKDQASMPRFIKSGEKIKYVVTMLKVQTQEGYLAEQAEIRAKQDSTDAIIIQNYLSQKKWTDKAQKLNAGTYLVLNETGKGEVISSSPPNIDAKYTLSVLKPDGKMETVQDFASNTTTLSTNRMVAGLRDALPSLRVGSKSTIIIPSTRGYGSRKFNNIDGNSVLIYDINIINTREHGEDAPKEAAKK